MWRQRVVRVGRLSSVQVARRRRGTRRRSGRRFGMQDGGGPGLGHVCGGGSGRRRRERRQQRKEEEAARALLEGADVRAGAPLPATALPVGARTRAPGEHPATYADAGEDMVPEPSLQVEEGAPGEGTRTDTAAVAASRRRAGFGSRRQAVPADRQQWHDDVTGGEPTSGPPPSHDVVLRWPDERDVVSRVRDWTVVYGRQWQQFSSAVCRQYERCRVRYELYKRHGLARLHGY